MIASDELCVMETDALIRIHEWRKNFFRTITKSSIFGPPKNCTPVTGIILAATLHRETTKTFRTTVPGTVQ